MRVPSFAAVLALACTPALATLAAEVHARMDDQHVDHVANSDRTYVETDSRDDTLLTARGLHLRDRATATF